MDLEILVSVCGGSTNDRKITCETLADDAPDNTATASEDAPPDLPPESFWLSKDAEFDWFDRNAFLERKESTKAISSSTAANSNNPNISDSNSHRFVSNLISKARILGLPKTNYVADAKRRQCRLTNIKLFPKRPDSVSKLTTVISMAEPSSPKVSCMGRVRSKRGPKKPDGPVTESKKPELRTSKSVKKKKEKKPVVDQGRTGNNSVNKSGIFSRLKLIFESNGHRRRRNIQLETVNEPAEESSPRRSMTVNKGPEYSTGAVADPPCIGAMTRFVSGRRSDAFGVDADEVSRDSLELGRRGPGFVDPSTENRVFD